MNNSASIRNTKSCSNIGYSLLALWQWHWLPETKWVWKSDGCVCWYLFCFNELDNVMIVCQLLPDLKERLRYFLLDFY
jgi:hypothetical protein